MKTLILSNPGLIDLAAITTMGVSVKETDSPIGFFGTGLKYAIATILRLKGKVIIYRGLDEPIHFSTIEKSIRGRSFCIIKMNDRELGFTTDLGKHWNMQAAFREFYSNCLDENGIIELSDSFPIFQRENKTIITIEQEEVEKIYHERGEIFLMEPAIEDNYVFSAHRKISEAVFYRSVNVGESYASKLYTYNIKDELTLTEDRTFKYDFEVNRRISRGIALSNNKLLIESILTAPVDLYESGLEFSQSYTYSPEFIEVAASLVKEKKYCNCTLKKLLLSKGIEGINEHTPYILSKVETAQLKKAINVLARARIGVDKYPIKTVESLGEGILGRALDKSIYISKLAFSTSTKEVAATLFEEYAHLESTSNDCTREFQNYIINTLLSAIEHLVGDPI